MPYLSFHSMNKQLTNIKDDSSVFQLKEIIFLSKSKVSDTN